MSRESERFSRVRAATEALVSGLTPEDLGGQAFAEASPAKWHLAHTTWFFDTFVLAGRGAAHPAFRHLFNSYYDTVGSRPRQAERGWLTRPPLSEVMSWRHAVDEAVAGLLRAGDPTPAFEVGLAHEGQHQELILTDGLSLFARNPLEPAWIAASPPPHRPHRPLEWIEFPGGLVDIGADGSVFAFDNERPRHRHFLAPFRLASRPVSNGEWLAFIEDGGYTRPLLWQSDGWDMVQAEGWTAPLYWRRDGDGWTVMSLWGRRRLDPTAPVCHVSWYEADAYARWAGARLPLEAELEVASGHAGLYDITGAVWQWTGCAHRPYPGYEAPAGAFGEYNGKFMVGRMVLRGGSFATPSEHLSPTTRNFWWPAARWQFTGLRLAVDA